MAGGVAESEVYLGGGGNEDNPEGRLSKDAPLGPAPFKILSWY